MHGKWSLDVAIPRNADDKFSSESRQSTGSTRFGAASNVSLANGSLFVQNGPSGYQIQRGVSIFALYYGQEIPRMIMSNENEIRESARQTLLATARRFPMNTNSDTDEWLRSMFRVNNSHAAAATSWKLYNFVVVTGETHRFFLFQVQSTILRLSTDGTTSRDLDDLVHFSRASQRACTSPPFAASVHRPLSFGLFGKSCLCARHSLSASQVRLCLRLLVRTE